MNVYLLKRALLTAIAILLFAGCAQTGHQHAVSPAPAYRPDTEHAEQFVKSIKTASLAVFPTIVRTVEQTTYSETSQRQIVSQLNQQQVTSAVPRQGNLDPGPLRSPPQWEIFVHDMNGVAEALKDKQTDTDYSLVMEIIFPPGNQSVWGIHAYIFDRQANNAFSFLLNSHHRLFRNAQMHAEDASAEARDGLVEKATQVGIEALIQQLKSSSKTDRQSNDGYSISSQTSAAYQKSVDKIFIYARIHERLQHVVMRSLKHSLESGFASNDVEAVVKLMPRDANDYAKFTLDVVNLEPDALMYIDLDPLLRMRKDGYEAIVGTYFEVGVVTSQDKETIWQAEGKVDYIKMFGPGYVAHDGIRKELAWHTTAAIVRTFIQDVNGHKSAPIYTVTEDRQLHGQRID